MVAGIVVVKGSSVELNVDVVVIGAGAAGLMCAATAGKRGRDVLVLDHANKVGKKILMSGGGRCNFTNTVTDPDDYVSGNAHFCKSALSRYTPWDFIDLVERYGIAYHEKKLGQLFCDNSSKDILGMLLAECEGANVEIKTHCKITSITKSLTDPDAPFVINSSSGLIKTKRVVMATGGLSIPTMGATGFGYQIAQQFGHEIITTEAALVPFTLSKEQLQAFDGLSGVSANVVVSCGNQSFREAMLFTHRGFSGPAMLQISTYWKPGKSIIINWLPDIDALKYLQEQQEVKPNVELKTVLSEHLSKRLVLCLMGGGIENKPMRQYTAQKVEAIAQLLSCWDIMPAGTEGYRTAEVTIGGVSTDKISSKTFESQNVSGLFFIGEVLDVTGHLGGFNFQWAWASGVAAGQVV
ncbi:MAG: NAD(P)/FAD-dependent oxidoreductase [Pseudomonadales bacterium]|nr:NAD(P)/FAD-dependent oxidoreductase [Pseudomonadales bacterium]